MTQLVLQGARGSRHVGKRTFTNVIFRVSNLANLNLHLRKRNRNVRVGCIVSYYNISRRGLTRVAYLDEGAMREPETWDKREVVTPTSFIYYLKQKAETWEVDRLADLSAFNDYETKDPINISLSDNIYISAGSA